MAVAIGETKSRFWMGECFRFKRVARGEWECTSHEYWRVPRSIKDELATWD